MSDVIGGETVGINLDTGHYYSLPDVASEIWSFVRRRLQVGRIVEEVLSAYEGDATAIEGEVVRFIAGLRDEGLVVPDEGDPPPSEAGEPSRGSKRRQFRPPLLEKYSDMCEFLLVDPIHEVDVTEWPHVRRRSDSG